MYANFDEMWDSLSEQFSQLGVNAPRDTKPVVAGASYDVDLTDAEAGSFDGRGFIVVGDLTMSAIARNARAPKNFYKDTDLNISKGKRGVQTLWGMSKNGHVALKCRATAEVTYDDGTTTTIGAWEVIGQAPKKNNKK